MLKVAFTHVADLAKLLLREDWPLLMAPRIRNDFLGVLGSGSVPRAAS